MEINDQETAKKSTSSTHKNLDKT